MGTVNIRDFLLARIEEDEDAARAAGSGGNRFEKGPNGGFQIVIGSDFIISECQKRRRMVDTAALMTSVGIENHVISHLAAEYADHPDYQKEWAVQV